MFEYVSKKDENLFLVQTQNFLLFKPLCGMPLTDLGSESLPDPAVFWPPQPFCSFVAFFFLTLVAFKLLPIPEQTAFEYIIH